MLLTHRLRGKFYISSFLPLWLWLMRTTLSTVASSVLFCLRHFTSQTHSPMDVDVVFIVLQEIATDSTDSDNKVLEVAGFVLDLELCQTQRCKRHCPVRRVEQEAFDLLLFCSTCLPDGKIASK